MTPYATGLLAAPLPVIVGGVFTLTGGYSLIRMILVRRRTDRIVHLVHLLMSAMMILMVAGRSAAIPALVQILIFSAAGLWFGYQVLFGDHDRLPGRPDGAGPGPEHGGGRRLAYHAMMMFAMVWMAALMAPATPASAAHDHGGGGAHDHLHAAVGASTVAAGGVEPVVTGWTEAISTAFGIGFALAAVWYLGRFVLRAGSPATPTVPARLIDLAAASAMAAGMALTFLVVM